MWLYVSKAFWKSTKTLQGYTEEEAVERAEKIFKSLDHNGDGNLVEDEFVKVREENYGEKYIFCYIF